MLAHSNFFGTVSDIIKVAQNRFTHFYTEPFEELFFFCLRIDLKSKVKELGFPSRTELEKSARLGVDASNVKIGYFFELFDHLVVLNCRD